MNSGHPLRGSGTHHDFRTTPFSGTLLDLIAICARWVPCAGDLVRAQEWLAARMADAGDVLPVRKFRGHGGRGEVVPVGGLSFLIVDNEPLAGLYQLLVSGGWRDASGRIRDLLDSRTIPGSFLFEEPPSIGGRWRTGMPKTDFRPCGILLAHLFDAAQGDFDHGAAGWKHRFFRTMNPVNCFPFPGIRQVDFESDSPNADPSGDPWVQRILIAWMAERIGPAATETWFRLSGARPEPLPDWRAAAARFLIATRPKAAGPAKATAPRRAAVSGAAHPGPTPHVPHPASAPPPSGGLLAEVVRANPALSGTPRLLGGLSRTVVAWRSTRLVFPRVALDLAAAPDDILLQRIDGATNGYVPGWLMLTRSQFEPTFGGILDTQSWIRDGRYSWPSAPRKMAPHFIPD